MNIGSKNNPEAKKKPSSQLKDHQVKNVQAQIKKDNEKYIIS